MSLFSPFRRAAPLPALLGLLLFFCAGFADGVLVPFFPLWAQHDAHIPVAAIGLLFACYAGGEILAAPVLGGIADRVGRRPVLILSTLGVGLGFTALFLVRSIPAAAAVLLFTGICESVLHPTVQTVIADCTAPAAHRGWFGRVRVANGAGQVLGPAVGALLATHSLRAVFLVAGGVLLLGGIAVLLLLPETRVSGAADDGEDEEESLSALLPALRDRRLASLLLWFTLFDVTGNWIESVIPLYAHDAGTLSASGIGALFSFAALLTVVLQLAVGRLGEGRGPLPLVLGAGACAGTGFALLLASPAIAAIVGAVALCAISQMLTGPLLPATIAALAPPSRRAAYMAAASLATDLKDSLGPSVGTALYAVAPRLPWIVAIPLVASASLGLGAALTRAGARRLAA
ncbi:MAG: MFS transporter [Gluconacetobacter diazotrophicus]|nr:MFS transporter [Gluconacetobacter diazotrophicus]